MMTQEATPHNVFISWSGDLSKKIALAVHDWLPTVIQAVNPFLSNRDITPGTRGMAKIAEHLQDIRIGIICVTAENQSTPWLNFEAGALSKMVDESYVIPLAFDIEKGQIRKPLGEFQAVLFAKEDLFDVVSTINEALGSPAPLSTAKLQRAFDLTWPTFATEIENIRTEHAQTTFLEEPKRSSDDMLEELVVTVREQQRMLAEILDTQFLHLRFSTGGRFVEGQRVLHSKFGQGTIISTHAREDDDREILVRFDDHGTKRLIESLAGMILAP
jgi:hypothetical protein